MIDCKTKCPFNNKQTIVIAADRDGKVLSVDAQCYDCVVSQLREAETRANYLEEVINGIAVLVDAGDIETARECCE